MDLLVLSIFPGIDLLGRAFEEEGYCVVRGPDLLWGGDIKTFHPPAGRFQGVIGGPPCVGESQWSYLNTNRGYSLWSEAMRVIDESKPEWWVLEAVIKHDAPYVIKLSPRYLGEKQRRVRYFHSNLNLESYIEISLFDNPVKEDCVLATEYSKGHRMKTGAYYDGYHPSRPWKTLCELQGLPEDFDLLPFTKEWKGKVLGNGVPLPMGRAIAKAVRKATL